MATRSDFAQKLLNDLKMRKERMSVSKNSSHSSPMVGDTRGKPGPTYKGSRQIKTLESIGSKAVNSLRRSNGGNRPPSIEDSSKQMVPFGRSRNNSEQIGDLSMALAFAIENGANSSMLNFLNQIGRRSFDYGKMERSGFVKHGESTGQFPTFSQLHIKEISKGAQNLNQILRACSNGLNFDGYSIEIGKQLLKGALDLEESLRMLVTMQEASEYMVTPQRKSRIRLLEEDEEDDESNVNIAEQKQLDRPRFSFDKPSRGEKLMALTYRTDAHNYPSNQAITTLNLVPHKRSTNYGPDFKTLSAFLEPKNHSSSSQSKSDKGKISNVIAKLMGLEELPVNGDSKMAKKESSSKHQERTVMKKSTNASTKNSDPKTTSQANKIPLTLDATYVAKAEKVQTTRNGNLEGLVSDGKSQRKDLERSERITSVSDSKKTIIGTERQQCNINQVNQITGSRKDFQQQERRQNNIKHKEQNSKERGENKAPQRHKSLDTANILQEKIGNKESTLQTGEGNANRLLPSIQPKPQDNNGFHQPHKLRKPEPQEEKHETEKREQQNKKQKFPVRKKKEIEAEPKSSSKVLHDSTSLQKKQPQMNQVVASQRNSTESVDARPLKGHPSSRNQEDLARVGSSSYKKVDTKNSTNRNSDQKASPRELGSETEKPKHSTPPVTEVKPVRGPAKQKKADLMKMHRSETPRKMDEVMTRRNGTPRNLPRSLKHQLSIFQEMKQRRHAKINGSKVAEQVSGTMSKEAQPHIIRSNNSEASIQPLNAIHQVHKESEQATLHGDRGDEFQSLKVHCTPTADDSCQNISSELPTVSVDHEELTPAFCEDQVSNSHKTESRPLTGTYEESMEIPYPTQRERKKVSTSGTQELLTENESLLKQTLMNSQVVIHTAEAFFKLNIPIGILNVEDNTSQDEDSKLILDCGYEIMKRKGRNQELAVHPFVKISVSSVKVIRSLDDLVRQLSKDFERLKFYGRNGVSECDASDYLLKMLERDVQNRDLDLNCMWDFGWNEMMFAFLEKIEVIRDVEKQMLNELVDEVMEDLLHVSFSI